MKELLRDINNLKKTKIKETIDSRINEFKSINRNSAEQLFEELCFCILTANFNAERTIKIQKILGNKFLTASKQELTKRLKELGHRFPESRAGYILEARRYKDLRKEILKKPDENEIRDWLVKNIKGLGYKEASHFLRNIGYNNFAIIDFHIIDLLSKYNLIQKPKTLTKSKYLEIEQVLKKIADNSNLSLAELDLYLWYSETGKILK